MPYIVPSALAIFFQSGTNGFNSVNVQSAIEEVSLGAGGLKVFQSTAQVGTLNVSYLSGNTIFNGTIRIVTGSTLAIGASVTNFVVYVNNAGTVAVAATAPDDAVPLALITTSGSAVTSITDIRSSMNNNIIYGLVADIQALTPDIAAAAGTSVRFARADHVHNVPADAAVAAATDSANAEGSSSSFSRADHVHEVNIFSNEVTATADTTNAGTVGTPNVMTGMSFTTPPAGTYKAIFGTHVDHSAQSVAVVVSLFVGGTQRADTVRAPVPRFNALGANSLNPGVSICAIVTVNGSQNIDIRWGTASGTATAHQRTFNIERLS